MNGITGDRQPSADMRYGVPAVYRLIYHTERIVVAARRAGGSARRVTGRLLVGLARDENPQFCGIVRWAVQERLYIADRRQVNRWETAARRRWSGTLTQGYQRAQRLLAARYEA